jgi:hypothetical protein
MDPHWHHWLGIVTTCSTLQRRRESPATPTHAYTHTVTAAPHSGTSNIVRVAVAAEELVRNLHNTLIQSNATSSIGLQLRDACAKLLT